MPLVTSTTALNAETGEVWTRQFVHHDIWDYDTNSAPTLVDLHKDGKIIPALVQATKQGLLFELNRKTGEPVYPIEERHYPASDVPGEKASPIQPYVPVPEPTVPDHWAGVFPLADIADFGYCSRTLNGKRDEGRYTPPSLPGSVTFPGTIGGVEWAGGAVDPNTQTYVVNSSDVTQIYKLTSRDEYNKILKENGITVADAAQAGSPYAFRLSYFLNDCVCPAGNRLTAHCRPMT